MNRFLTLSALIAGITFSPLTVLAETKENSGTLPQLDPSTFPTQLFWLFVFFGLLYIILSKISLPRIAQVIEMRHEKMHQDYETAQELKEKVDSIKTEYEAELTKAHADIASLMKKTHEDIAKNNMTAHDNLSKEIKELTTETERKLAEQTTQALARIQECSTVVAVEIANKLAPIVVNDNEASKAVTSQLKKERS